MHGSILEWWMEKYRWITGLLGIDPSSDYEARDRLSAIIGDYGLNPSLIDDLINGRVAIVIGAGPSLGETLDLLGPLKHLLQDAVLIAADSAVKPMLMKGLRPNIIVSDLDGDIPSIIRALEGGAVIMVHAHGDNIDRIEEFVPLFIRKGYRIIGTTQVEPLWNVQNYGGFTDGDRAAYIAYRSGASRIILLGMDLGYRVGEYSLAKGRGNPSWLSRKLTKLKIAEALLTDLACLYRAEIFNISYSAIGCAVNMEASQGSLSILVHP